MLEKTLESPLDSKIKPDNLKGNHPWIFIGRSDAEAEAPILWPPDVKSQLVGKDLDARKDWDQEKMVTENEMVALYHQLNGHEFEQTPGDTEGQGGLACCSPLGCKETQLRDWVTIMISPLFQVLVIIIQVVDHSYSICFLWSCKPYSGLSAGDGGLWQNKYKFTLWRMSAWCV